MSWCYRNHCFVIVPICNIKKFPVTVTSVTVIFVRPWNENVWTKQKQQLNRSRGTWLVYWMDTNEWGFFWLVKWMLWWKKLYARQLSRNQPILRFDVILQHNWPIEQRLLHSRVFFDRKTQRPCFDLFINWLIKQITNKNWNHFSRSYENRSNKLLKYNNNNYWQFITFWWVTFTAKPAQTPT